MGLMDKLRQMISPSPLHQHEHSAPSPRQTPQFGEPRVIDASYQRSSRKERPNDPLLIASPNENEDDHLGPVLDHEWELYSPQRFDLDQEEPPLEVDSSPWDKSLEEEQSAAESQVLIEDNTDLISDDLHSPISLELSLPEDQSSKVPALPATDFLSEVPPPLLDDDSSLDQPHDMIWSESHSLGEGSVFVPSNQRRDSPLRSHLSLALLPVAIPSPLSYALVYRDQISYHLSHTENEESERNTELLIELFECYTTLVPNDIQMWQDYSDLLIETRGLEYAYSQVKNALGKTRDDTSYLLMLADMSRRMCDTHTAWHYISILNDVHPNDMDVLLQLRDIQRECKFYELAENTDAHIERLLKSQKKSLDPLS